MALSDYQPDRVPVMYRDKVLVRVRGLNMEDVGLLMRHHLSDLQTIYQMYQDQKLLPNAVDLQPLLLNLLTQAPVTAALTIAVASDDTDDFEVKVAAARRLSAPLQMKILGEIVRLTVQDVGGPLEFREMLTTMMSLPTSMASPNQTSANQATT